MMIFKQIKIKQLIEFRTEHRITKKTQINASKKLKEFKLM